MTEEVKNAKKDILDNWTDTEKEDALTAIYDSEFATHMIKEGSKPVSTTMLDKSYQDAIIQINEEGGFL